MAALRLAGHMKGRLIVVEGIDAAGKATQAQNIARFLEKSQPVAILDYPEYGKPIGDLISRFLRQEFTILPEAQFLLYAADMLKDMPRIRQLLDQGTTVLLNRYLTSTLAYQGSQGFPLEKGLAFLKLFEFPVPNLLFYLDISPATSLARKRKQKPDLDRFESQEAFQEQAARFYRKMISSSVPGKWIPINGEPSPDKVFAQIRKHL